MNTTRFTNDDLANRIQELFRERASDGKTMFRVTPGGIDERQNPFADGHWYYVEALAVDPDMPMHRFGPLFGEIEQKLEDEYGIHSLIIPVALPD
ncbi:MAG: hypothetical protein AAFX76_05835 [Planctomycetota bacterium]